MCCYLLPSQCPNICFNMSQTALSNSFVFKNFSTDNRASYYSSGNRLNELRVCFVIQYSAWTLLHL